jgi:Na+/proline symporter
MARVEQDFGVAISERKAAAFELLEAGADDEAALAKLEAAQASVDALREEAKTVIKQGNAKADTNDTNYIFLSYVFDFLPAGLIGLIISVIFSASMSSTSSELNALASTTVIDVYKRLVKTDADDAHYFKVSKWSTVAWGGYAIIFAMFANRLGTLIEAVNILGSLVYGTILGIFMVAFFLKKVGGKAVFLGAVLAEALILSLFFFTKVPFLWYNVIGCLAVILTAIVLQAIIPAMVMKKN